MLKLTAVFPIIEKSVTSAKDPATYPRAVEKRQDEQKTGDLFALESGPPAIISEFDVQIYNQHIDSQSVASDALSEFTIEADCSSQDGSSVNISVESEL